MKRSKPLQRRTPLARRPLQQVRARLHAEQSTTGTSKQRRAGRRRDDSKWAKECLRRYGAWCRACGDTRHIQVDHMIPRSQGGPSVLENGLILGGPFGCAHHDEKTAHRLLIQRAWLTQGQVWWLEGEGHAVWEPDGTVSGRHCRLFAPIERTDTEEVVR